MATIDLEELAEETKEDSIKSESGKGESDNTNKQDKNTKEIYSEAENILKLPFEVAMQNLKITEDEIIEAGKKLFEEGNFIYEIKLPFGHKAVLQSKKVMDETDYYNFLYNAIEQQMNMEEFQYMLNIRNLAHCLVSIDDQDYTKYEFDEKLDILLNKPAPLIASIINSSSKFWSILLLMLHKDFVGFLMKKSQQ